MCAKYENSIKSARAFRQVQFERISKTISRVNPNELSEYLFNVRLGKSTDTRTAICTAHCNNKDYLCSYDNNDN